LYFFKVEIPLKLNQNYLKHLSSTEALRVERFCRVMQVQGLAQNNIKGGSRRCGSRFA